MAIGTNGLFGRGFGTTDAGTLGLFARGVLGIVEDAGTPGPHPLRVSFASRAKTVDFQLRDSEEEP